MKQFIFLLMALPFIALGQNQITRNGKISFYSHTKIEDIKAVNNEAFSSLNTQTGSIQFLVLIKGFQFKSASMQQHFNDVDYMNSSEFPKSEFKGVINNLTSVNFAKDGSYPVTVSGDLTMHGVTKKTEAKGTIMVKQGKISSTSSFVVKLADYNISVPTIVTSKVAESVEINVDCSYEPFKR